MSKEKVQIFIQREPHKYRHVPLKYVYNINLRECAGTDSTKM